MILRRFRTRPNEEHSSVWCKIWSRLRLVTMKSDDAAHLKETGLLISILRGYETWRGQVRLHAFSHGSSYGRVGVSFSAANSAKIALDSLVLIHRNKVITSKGDEGQVRRHAWLGQVGIFLFTAKSGSVCFILSGFRFMDTHRLPSVFTITPLLKRIGQRFWNRIHLVSLTWSAFMQSDAAYLILQKQMPIFQRLWGVMCKIFWCLVFFNRLRFMAGYGIGCGNRNGGG